MDDGRITVLDLIDDMLMAHSVDWSDGEDAGDKTDARVAWVHGWLGVRHDYYAQGCTVRRDGDIMRTSELHVNSVTMI